MNKVLYKVDIWYLKIIPSLLFVVYSLCFIFSCSKTWIITWANIGFLSLIPALYIILSSYTFQFCATHRIPIYCELSLNYTMAITWFKNNEIIDENSAFILFIGICFVLYGIIKNHVNNRHTKE